MKIKVTLFESQYLKNNGWIQDCELDQDGFIYLDDEIIEEIREKALNKQQVTGFDIDYKLTQEGQILESIIDKFYI